MAKVYPYANREKRFFVTVIDHWIPVGDQMREVTLGYWEKWMADADIAMFTKTVELRERYQVTYEEVGA